MAARKHIDGSAWEKTYEATTGNMDMKHWQLCGYMLYHTAPMKNMNAIVSRMHIVISTIDQVIELIED